MKNAFTGIMAIIMVMLFLGVSACAPGRAMTRGNVAAQKDDSAAAIPADEGTFTYNYDDDAAVEEPRAERRTRDAGKAPRVRSEARSNSEDKNIAYSEEDASRQDRYFQTGVASWYGREFHGKLTASGERFDMNASTAAHRTLPFGSMLMVKNLDNGKSVRVRINDRGPFRGGRIIDLSYAAAQELGMVRSGEAKVGISVLSEGNGRRSTASAGVNENAQHDVEGVSGDEERMDAVERNERVQESESVGSFAVQAGAFSSRLNAQSLKKKIQQSVNNPVIVIRDGDFFKVRIESIRSEGEARRIRRMLENESISSFMIRNRE